MPLPPPKSRSFHVCHHMRLIEGLKSFGLWGCSPTAKRFTTFVSRPAEGSGWGSDLLEGGLFGSGCGLCRLPVPTLAWCLPSLSFSQIRRYVFSVFQIVLIFKILKFTSHVQYALPQKLFERKKETHFQETPFLIVFLVVFGVVQQQTNGWAPSSGHAFFLIEVCLRVVLEPNWMV